MHLKRSLIIVLLIFVSCTGRYYPSRDRYEPSGDIDNTVIQDDLGEDLINVNDEAAMALREDIRSALTEAENYYSDGVMHYQNNNLDSSQIAFEEALLIMSDLEFDQDIFPEESRWLETMLKEIESDYRLTLMSSGVLYSEGSAAAFREMFSDIKNFEPLRETGKFHGFQQDSVTYDVPIYLNEKVENSLIYLQTVSHDVFEKYLNRSGRYIPRMKEILREEGVPDDIVFLPLIESGFNANAYSFARAMGFWQFIYSTGKRYGLKRNWWYDERCDFEKSTRAAARYLKDLYDEFGHWELALAGYNGGEGRVRREIKKHKTKDFWKLRLKKETKNYVPLFMAATIIAKEPNKYGFYPEYHDPLEWEVVKISKCMSFENISAKTGISVSDLELLNPELRRGITPPDMKDYSLRVPPDAKPKFLAVYDQIPSEKNTNWVQHKIKRGETVSMIARKYRVSVSSIVAANNLRRPYRIIAGKTLMVPTASGNSYSSGGNVDIIPDGSGYYKVRRGDTLWEIARAHGVTITSIKRANNLTSNRIYAGRRLLIPNGKAPASSYTSSGDIHIVRRGESLFKIAKRYGVPVQAIKTLNRLRSNTIYPNMRLKIPQRSSSGTLSDDSNEPQFHKVRRGDNLWQIAKRYGVTVQQIVAWNDISDPENIPRGKTLKIYRR